MFSITLALIILNLSLGGVIILRAYRDRGAILFFLITLAFAFLSLANYYSLSEDLQTALMWIRIEMFLAVWHTFLFFLFVYFFGRKSFPSQFLRASIFVLLFLAMLVISVSRHLYSGVSVNASTGHVETTLGVLFPVFALWLIGTMILSMVTVVRRFRQSTGVEKDQWRWLLIGSLMTYSMLVISNFVFAGFLHNTSFLKFTPLYSIPIIVSTAYAVVRHGLFNLRVIATEAFVAIISFIYLAGIFTSTSANELVVNILIFVITAFFGFLLVRSVKAEIATREKVQKLANSLSETNWELAKRNEQLRVIDQRKSEFVSIVSHQLRTPITAIKGYSSLALEGVFGELREDLRDALDKVFVSSGRLADMVSDFLDISKIEQGTMQFIFSKADVATMLHDVVTDVRPRAEEKGLGLHLTIPADQSFAAIVDDGKMRQIFSNVIDNSIKYTPKGEISISLERDEEKKRIICHIKDTGIGLSSDDIHHLFGKFNRGSGGSKINTGGSGLGLYVAKRMLETHGGNIWVDSPGVNKGSVFVIELPTPENVKSHTVGSWTAAAKEEDGEPVEAITGIV